MAALIYLLRLLSINILKSIIFHHSFSDKETEIKCFQVRQSLLVTSPVTFLFHLEEY